MLSMGSMFFRLRSTQAEYFDSERPKAELGEFFQVLNRMNGWFGFAEAFQRLVPEVCGEGCGELGLLDVGAGNGTLGDILARWAGQRGWNWRVTSLDSCPASLALGKGERRVAGSALRLPLADSSFDVVISSQMAHHLSDREVVLHLKEAWRVARVGIVVSDLHRNPGLYGLLWAACWVKRLPKMFREDALLSVRRGWRVGELRTLARQAGIPEPNVKLYFGARVNLWARKERAA